MIAISLVAVLLVAGVGIYLVTSDDSEEPMKIDSELSVYGNANNDYTIDSKDLSIIDKIIAGECKLSEYPLADANKDGKVTSADKDIVNKVIKDESADLVIIDQLGREVSVKYPLDNVIAVRSDVSTFMACAGFDEHVYGFTGTSDYKFMYEGIKKAGGTHISKGSSVDAELWQKIVQADSELYTKGESIGAIVVDRVGSFGDFADDMEQAGIPGIGIRVTDPNLVLSGTLLMGFLFGPEAYGDCKAYVAECEKAMNYLDEKLDKLTEDEKIPFISVISYRCVSGDESQYTKLGIAAGGIPMTKIKGDTSPQLQSVEAITEYDELIEQILAFRTIGCYNLEPAEYWEYKTMPYVEKSAWYEDMVLINCSMPVTCRVLYAASVLYPELISEDYADSVFQKIVDEHMTYLNDTQEDGHFDVSKDMTTTMTYQDYLDSKK